MSEVAMLEIIGSSMMNSVDEAIGVHTRWGDAFIAQDVDGMVAEMHFPHLRLLGTDLQVMQTEEEFRTSQPEVTRRLRTEGFSQGVVDSIEAVQFGSNKVHLAVRMTRQSADGTGYKTFDTLWIVTLIDGKWAAKFRSSFR
jgi:hypothetical protein